MKISIIIPTYNREEPLRDSIIDVLKQDYPNREILVIDQTPTHKPDIQNYLEEQARVGNIKWYRLPWASLPGARNYGMRRASGDIILFIDDDIQMPSGFLLAHAQNYLNNPQIGAVAGRIFDRMKLSEIASSEYSIETLPPEAMDPSIAWYYIDLVHTIKAQQVLTARGCNMSFRRNILLNHQLYFDERFAGNAVREESDFCLRFRQTGLMIWYDPNAHLIHLGEETGGCHDVSTKSFNYQINFYQNHFLLGLKNLTLTQQIRFFTKFFDCHVLGKPPCNKSGSLIKIIARSFFYFFCLFRTMIIILFGNHGQIYTAQDELASN